jgi:hypothetical protein
MADANADDVRVMKEAIWVAYFKRLSADENHSVLCALKVQISFMSSISHRYLPCTDLMNA